MEAALRAIRSTSPPATFWVYFGTPPYGGCTGGTQQTEANIIGGSTPQWFVDYSNTPVTYSQARFDAVPTLLVWAQTKSSSGRATR